MNDKQLNRLIAKLKSKTVELDGYKQIPHCLAILIFKLDKKSSEPYVRCLSEITEHYLRVIGYYKKYQNAEQKACIEINMILKENHF